MATIRSALSLYDGMTGPLQSIHKALNIVLNSFEAVQSASGNAIDSSAIQEAREELARAGSQLDEIQDHIRNAEREQDQFNDRIRDGANATDGLAHKFSKLKTIVATLGISAGIKKLGELSDQFTSTRARLNLIADDGGSVEAVQQKLNTLTQDKTVDVAANIQNNINTTRTEMVDDLANKLNDLNQNATVSVTASDNGTVDAIENRLNELDQAVKVPVDVTDQNSVNEVQTKIDSLTTAVTVDIGTKSTIENQLNQLNRNITIPVNVTDNNSITTVQQKIEDVPHNIKVDVFATDNETIDGIGNRIDNLTAAVTVPVDLTDNGTIKTVQQKIDGLTQSATMNVSADIETKISGNKAVERFIDKVGDLPKNKEIIVSATDNGTTDEIGNRLNGLTENVTVPVKVTDNKSAEIVQEKIDGLKKTAEVGVAVDDAGTIDDLGNRLDGLDQAVTIPVNVTDNNSVKMLEAKIMASAQRSRSSYFDTANAIASMGANARSAFSTNDELIAFMEQINKQFVIGGASAQGQAAAMLQLTQAMGAGALRGEELNSILENAPGIARAIEQYMGVAEGSIKKYAEEGLITAEVVKNAMFAAADETNAKFDSMPMTWAQIWTSMQNRAIQSLEPILEKINAIANSDRMQGMVDGAMDAFFTLIGVLGIILDLTILFGSTLYDNWSWISPIIYGIAGALAVYHGWQLAVKTQEMIMQGIHMATAAAQMIHAAATGTLTAATAAEIAAQNGLNAALYACPIMWVVILVIALIAAFYAAVAAINKFAGTSVSATGIICGAFMAALAFIGNIFVALWNITVDVFTLIYNLVATVANFIGNVFNDPVGAVARLFFDLADTVLGVLESLASAIDTIFGSNLAGAVSGWRNSLGSWVDSTFGKGEEIMEKMNGDDLKLGRFEYSAAFDLGYKFGEGLEDTVGGLFKTPTLDEMGLDSLDAFDLGNSLDGIYGNTGDTAANTAATADTLDYMDEDLAWMKDIAEREAINRYVTAEITVEQHNENHISKDTDLDGVMDAFCFDFAEKLDISAEGVHE